MCKSIDDFIKSNISDEQNTVANITETIMHAILERHTIEVNH